MTHKKYQIRLNLKHFFQRLGYEKTLAIFKKSYNWDIAGVDIFKQSQGNYID